MSAPTFLYFLAIIACLPAALRVTGFKVRIRNATAFAMVAMWLLSRLVWMMTGEYLPLQAMVIQDMAVIAAMFVKEDWCACPYRGTLHQLRCLWHERTPWDKAILSIFPLVWLLYAPILDPVRQFWVLWSLSLAQLMLAGLESHHLHAGNGQSLRAADERPPGLGFTAWERSYG